MGLPEEANRADATTRDTKEIDRTSRGGAPETSSRRDLSQKRRITVRMTKPETASNNKNPRRCRRRRNCLDLKKPPRTSRPTKSLSRCRPISTNWNPSSTSSKSPKSRRADAIPFRPPRRRAPHPTALPTLRPIPIPTSRPTLPPLPTPARPLHRPRRRHLPHRRHRRRLLLVRKANAHHRSRGALDRPVFSIAVALHGTKNQRDIEIVSEHFFIIISFGLF